MPAEMMESPGSKSIFFSNTLISSAHLTFSSLSPSVSFCALSSLTSHYWMRSLRLACSFMESWYFLVSSSIFWLILSSSSFFLRRNACFYSTCILRMASSFLRGSVLVYTSLYWYMHFTHIWRYLAA